MERKEDNAKYVEIIQERKEADGRKGGWGSSLSGLVAVHRTGPHSFGTLVPLPFIIFRTAELHRIT